VCASRLWWDQIVKYAAYIPGVCAATVDRRRQRYQAVSVLVIRRSCDLLNRAGGSPLDDGFVPYERLYSVPRTPATSNVYNSFENAAEMLYLVNCAATIT